MSMTTSENPVELYRSWQEALSRWGDTHVAADRFLLFGFWIFVPVTMQIVGFEHFPDVSQRLF
jgi:hypothetical protein